MSHSISRREMVAIALAAAARSSAAAETPPRLKIAIMSKFLQFLDVPGMAKAAASMCFDGVDLCVRPGAHIRPERVEQDLPRAVEIVRKAGLDVPMMTAAIVDDRSPHVQAILRTASGLGIRYYRWGGFTYKPDVPIAEQLEALKPRVKALADLNREHNMCAMYHTHSGPGQVGASIWDLWLLLKDFDPRWVSANFDIGHATVEGGYGGWVHDTRLILPYTRGLAFKDFRWDRNALGEYRPHWCPLGEGMVDFKRYLPLVKAAKFSGPVQLHIEYPLGGVDVGAPKLTISHEEAFAAMRRDLVKLRGWFTEYQL